MLFIRIKFPQNPLQYQAMNIAPCLFNLWLVLFLSVLPIPSEFFRGIVALKSRHHQKHAFLMVSAFCLLI